MKPLPRYLAIIFILGLAAAARAESSRPPVVTVGRSGGSYVAIGPDGAVIASGGELSVAANAAIAKVSDTGGGTVMIAAGTYDLAQPIQEKTGVRLVGAGGLLSDDARVDDYPTVLRAGRRGMAAVVEAINADGARIEHLTIDGGRMADAAVKTASYALRMRDCVLRAGTRNCILVTDGKALGHDMYVQATFINCRFDSEGRGVGLELVHGGAKKSSGPPARKGAGASSGESVAHKGAFTDGVVYRCRFVNVGDIGAEISGGWQFIDNQVSGAGARGGLAVYGGATAVTDNDIETTDGPAIAVVSGNVAITGNRLRRAGGGDVILVAKDAQAVTISRNAWAVDGGEGCFVDFRPGGFAPDSAVFGNSGQGGAVSRDASPVPGLYFADNVGGDPAGWSRPSAGDRGPAPAVGAYVALEGGQTVVRDPSGRRIAADPDAGIAINAAIGAVAGQGPGTVFVARGTYPVATPIALRPNIVLAGEGGMSRVPVGYEAMGTILKAAAADTTTVVDLTDAPGARVDELAVDGSNVAATCVKMAGRGEWTDDCFIERAAKIAVEITNGNATAAGAYSGMVLANTLVHAGGDSACVAVQSDPGARGEAPTGGTMVDARLRLGFIQAIFAGGPGWNVIGDHGTSNGHSKIGYELSSDSMYVSGNYFDTVHGPRVRIAGHDIDFLGNHFQATPTDEFPSIILAKTARNVRILSSTWHPPKGTQQSGASFFLRIPAAPPSGLKIIGNVGEGSCRVLNFPDAPAPGNCAGNFVAPAGHSNWQLDAGT